MSTGRLLVVAAAVATAITSAGTSSAMAVGTEGHWVINGAQITSTETVTATLSGATTLHTTVSADNTPVTLSCTGASLVDGTINMGGNNTLGAVKFTGCTVSEPSGCKVVGGQFEVLPMSGHLTLFLTQEEESKVEKGKYDLYTPINSEDHLGTVRLEGCAIEGSYKILGSIGCEISEVEAVTQECLFTKAGTKKTLTFGGHPLEYEAHFLVALAGANKGKPWSAKEV